MKTPSSTLPPTPRQRTFLPTASLLGKTEGFASRSQSCRWLKNRVDANVDLCRIKTKFQRASPQRLPTSLVVHRMKIVGVPVHDASVLRRTVSLSSGLDKLPHLEQQPQQIYEATKSARYAFPLS